MDDDFPAPHLDPEQSPDWVDQDEEPYEPGEAPF